VFTADYPGAIVVEAANYGYGTPNRPKTWGFHTPEEDADSYPSTPDYLAGTDRDASYTYFVSYLGFVFQLVPESEGAYGHGLEGKPEPDWSDGTNLNLQSFSLSFEGRTVTITQTMPRGSPQWKAGVDLVAHRTKAKGLNLDIAFQHKDVSIHRGDCGAWDQAAFIADVKAKMQEEEDMLTEEDKDWLILLRNDGVDMVEKVLRDHFEKVEKPWHLLLRRGGLDHIDAWAKARMLVILEAIKATSGGDTSVNEILDGLKERLEE
jgi:hypothetical protein